MIIKKTISVPKETLIEDGVKGVQKQVLLGPADGAPTFTMRQFSVNAGGYTFFHSHDFEHEIYILKGYGIARKDREEIPISADMVILVEPNELHQIVNNGTEELVFLCLIPNINE